MRTRTVAKVGGGVGAELPEDLAAAVSLAKAADVAVVVIGTMACGCCKRCGNGEVRDSRNATHPRELWDVCRAMHNT